MIKRYLGISKYVSNYSELARSTTENSGKHHPDTSWKVRALAELESYLAKMAKRLTIVKIETFVFEFIFVKSGLCSSLVIFESYLL